MEQQFSSQIINAVVFRCVNQNRAHSICSNEKCQKNAFICDKMCSCHTQDHKNCTREQLYGLLRKVEKEKIEIPEKANQTASALEKIYDQLIQQISLKRFAFLQGINLYGLKKNSMKLVRNLNQGNDNQIKGSLIAQVKLQLQDGPIAGMYQAQKVKQAWERQRYHVDLMLNELQSLGQQRTQKRIKQQKELVKMIGDQKTVILVHCGQNTQKWAFNKWFDRLKNFGEIKHIKLDNFSLKRIPIQLSALNRLIRLQLRNNGIKKIEHLQQLKELEILDLAYNQIEKIQGLDNQKKLRQFYLCYNKIVQLSNLEPLQSLTYLNLSGNQIQFLFQLPLPKLKTIYLKSCPLNRELIRDMVPQYKALGISLQVSEDLLKDL